MISVFEPWRTVARVVEVKRKFRKPGIVDIRDIPVSQSVSQSVRGVSPAEFLNKHRADQNLNRPSQTKH